MEIKLTDIQRDRLYVVLLVVAGIFMFGVIYMIGHHIDVFQKDPFRYGASQLGKVECSCMRYDTDGNFKYSFAFNSSSLWTVGQHDEGQQIGGDGLLKIK